MVASVVVGEVVVIVVGTGMAWWGAGQARRGLVGSGPDWHGLVWHGLVSLVQVWHGLFGR